MPLSSSFSALPWAMLIHVEFDYHPMYFHLNLINLNRMYSFILFYEPNSNHSRWTKTSLDSIRYRKIRHLNNYAEHCVKMGHLIRSPSPIIYHARTMQRPWDSYYYFPKSYLAIQAEICRERLKCGCWERAICRSWIGLPSSPTPSSRLNSAIRFVWVALSVKNCLG